MENWYYPTQFYQILCKVKAGILLEEEDVNLDEVNDWKMRSEHYKKLEKDAILKLETDELVERTENR